MLDFNLLAQQVAKIGKESFLEGQEHLDKIGNGRAAFDSLVQNSELFDEKLDLSAGRVFWPIARPAEPPAAALRVCQSSAPVTVVGVDGSQIMPSHHEVHTSYLLNVGRVVITYGSSVRPILESYPKLYHRPDDLYPLVGRRRAHIDELYVSLERTILELDTLAQTATESLERGFPVIAFVDGSLIPWSLEKLTDKYQEHFLRRMSAAMSQFQARSIPVLGYLSASRANDFVNMLRVAVCPYDVSDCRKHCANLKEESFPCSTIWPLADRQLFSAYLTEGLRSTIYLSGMELMRRFTPDQRVCFAYLHVGAEIARLEFPQWMMEAKDLLELAFSVALSQANKGLGYPICLSEAHHLAVVRGIEREKFFALLESRMIDLGFPKIRTSPKERSKKNGFV